MAAAFLPSILVPIVGIVFPALSMALFFIYMLKLMILANFYLLRLRIYSHNNSCFNLVNSF
jgi:photosystem I reaction center subunit VIII